MKNLGNHCFKIKSCWIMNNLHHVFRIVSILQLSDRPTSAKFAENVLFWGSRWRLRVKWWKKFWENCFKIIFWVSWTISTLVLWGNFQVNWVKGRNLQKLLKLLTKCSFGSQDDIIRPKWWKNFGKNLFQNTLLNVLNNLCHGLRGKFPFIVE